MICDFVKFTKLSRRHEKRSRLLSVSSSKNRRDSQSAMGNSESEDPLTLAIAPPPNETPEQRTAREFAEAQAKKVSDEIDEQLRKEREGDKKKKKPVKLLLLGQSKIITEFSLLTSPASRPK
ncbi:hypothetical protein H2248_002819 [Termitomyces sp. 'cryptogamus']|nr:hypothetical protein H2248_002819 [Termitomyces sp. 'cryptogamus']